MKKTITLLFILSICLRADAQIMFQKIYDGYSGNCVRQTNDGGYIIGGHTTSIGAGGGDGYLVRTDSIGQIVWTRTFGGTTPDEANSVYQTSDGGFILSGYSQSFQGVFAIKTDSNGDTLWTEMYEGVDGGWAQQTNDGGLIIPGTIGNGDVDINLFKTDINGNVIWSNRYGGLSAEYGYSLQQTNDGGYIIAGRVFNDIYIFKLDSVGNVIWSKAINGGSTSEIGYSVRQTNDGGYIITGDVYGFGNAYEVYLIKTDSIGNVLWSKLYGGLADEHGKAVLQTNDGGYIIVGETWSFGAGSSDVYLIKTDNAGNLIWSKTYGDVSGQTGKSIQQTSDGGYIITGRANTSTNNILLIKTDSLGNSGCNQNNPVTVETSVFMQGSFSFTGINSTGIVGVYDITVGTGGIETTICSNTQTGQIEQNIKAKNILLSPNPATSEIRISDFGFQISHVEIFNVLGEKVYSNAGTSHTNSETINVNKLSSGIYFVRVKTKGGEMVGAAKFIKQ